jgi:hypothetical protein
LAVAGGDEHGKGWHGQIAAAVVAVAVALGSVTLGWAFTHYDTSQQQAQIDKGSLIALHLQVEAAHGYLGQVERRTRVGRCSLPPIPSISLPNATSATAIAALNDGQILFNVEIGEAAWEAFVAEHSDMGSLAAGPSGCAELAKAVGGTLSEVDAGLTPLNSYLIHHGL